MCTLSHVQTISQNGLKQLLSQTSLQDFLYKMITIHVIMQSDQGRECINEVSS